MNPPEFDLNFAASLADDLIADFSDPCKRVALVGSVLRRDRPLVKDLELLVHPEFMKLNIKNLFEEVVQTERVNLLEKWLSVRSESGDWGWELAGKDGAKQKRLQHKASGLICDLFIVHDLRTWGVQMAVRTGPADFSQALMRLARMRGLQISGGWYLHQHPKYGDRECDKGANCPLIFACFEETDFFAALNMPWIAPGARTVARLRKMWQKHRVAA